jgi:hypothetical protein
LGKSAWLGAAAGTAGGCMIVVGAVAPWQRFEFPGRPVAGCFGCGAGTFVFSGSQLENGEVALSAGVLMIMAGLLMAVFPAARKWLTITLAAAVVVAAGAIGGWWLKQMAGAVTNVGIIEASGIMLALAAVPLCLPGPIRKRALFLAATVLLCAVGVVLVRPASSGHLIVF